MTEIKLEKFTNLNSAAIVVGYSKTDDGYALATSIDDDDFIRACEASLATLRASGSHALVTQLVVSTAPSTLVFAVGICAEPDLEELREAAGAGVRAAAGLNEVSVALAHNTNAEFEAISEGALLGAYDFTRYRSEVELPVSLVHFDSNLDDAQTILDHSAVVAANVNKVRDLVNTPANDLNTESFAQYTVGVAEAAGCKIEVFDVSALKEKKLAGLLAVGQGSKNPPKLVRVEWNPQEAQGFTALVGKGIMFDTGGYSLKPSTAITEMKTDMGGAATILHAVISAAQLQLPTKVVGWMCLAENMVSDQATRPDDVITYKNGLSVEINNTDAEGRLVLADGQLMKPQTLLLTLLR